MSILPVQSAHALASRPAAQQWLIEDMWADGAVGIVGGEPKSCKSFLALDMAVSVAAGTPCLGHYRIARTGRVLLYAAEDALHVVRLRLDGIARTASVPLENLDVQVITAPTLRLDQETDRTRLAQTVKQLKPVLLVLDPFVRLHRIDENVSSEVAPLLAYLRELQRQYGVSVCVVHHAKKGAAKARAGQALRGSSEFHAWGDSNLYLRRTGDQLLLSIEQRAAPSIGGITVALSGTSDTLALRVVDRPERATATQSAASPPPTERVCEVLANAGEPLGLTRLRKLCCMRTQRLSQALTTLVADKRVEKTPVGYRLCI